VFERNIFKDGYTDVNRGRANRTGWNSIMGRIFISKSTNNVRIRGKIARYKDAPNMHG